MKNPKEFILQKFVLGLYLQQVCQKIPQNNRKKKETKRKIQRDSKINNI